MTEDPSSFLGCLQLTDSWFPSGLYTLSYGLESFVAETKLEASALEELLVDYVRSGVGPTDATALAIAHRAAGDADLQAVARADSRLTAVKLAREPREASARVGRQLLTLSGDIFGGQQLDAYGNWVRRGMAPGNHAAVLALVMSRLGVGQAEAVLAELHAFAASFLAAAVRLACIDHRVAQRILHRVAPVIAEAASAARERGLTDIIGCVPRIDIMAMRHERAELRLFMS